MTDQPARERVLAELAALIAAATRPHPLRVAIDGVDAAGKTTLSDELAPLVDARGRPVIRASVDGFHRPRAERYRHDPDSPAGFYRDSYDYPALRRCLLDPLGPGGDRRYRVAAFDHRRNAPADAPWLVAPPDAVLLLDGIFLQRPELAGCFELTIFVDVPFAETLARGVRRDTPPTGDPAATRARWERRYIPGQRLYLSEARPRERADVVVDNRDPAHPRLIRRESDVARYEPQRDRSTDT